TLAILKVPFFLPLGILSGFSSLVPYVGPICAGTFVTLVVFAAKGPVAALICAIYFVLYGQLEGNVLAPIVFKRTVEISPLLTLLAVLIFGTLGGVVGAIVAVPAVAAGQIILHELLELRRERMNSPKTGPV